MAERIVTTDHSDPAGRWPEFDDQAKLIVGDAIYALYAIRRLAICIDGELTPGCGDAPSFSLAIREISERQGKALDDCLKRAGSTGVGIFDKEHIDAEESEVAHA